MSLKPTILGLAALGRAALGYRRAAAPAARSAPFAVDLVGHLGRALPGVAAYPGRLPEKGAPSPALTFVRLHSARPLRLSGSSGVVVERYQLDLWGDDALEVATAAEDLRLALQNYRGPMGTAQVLSINLGPTQSGYEPPIDASDSGRFRETVEATVARRESIGRPAAT